MISLDFFLGSDLSGVSMEYLFECKKARDGVWGLLAFIALFFGHGSSLAQLTRVLYVML
jgi:hypothetical protein